MKSRLVYRLYAVGVAQLALVVLSAMLIGFAVSRFSTHPDLHGAIARVERVAANPARRASALSELRRDGLRLSLYDAERHLLASNVTPPLPLPLPNWIGREPGLPHHGPHGDGPDGHGPPPMPMPWDHAFSGPPPHGGPGHDHPPPPDLYARIKVSAANVTGGADGTLVARFEHKKPSPIPVVLTLAFGLLVFGAGAFLTARWIVEPLARLAQTARAIGRGDLRARSELGRDDELGQLGRTFDEMAERLNASMLAERELLANVSHELRTPLARIHVALEIAAEGDTETARSSLAEIAVDLAELETLVDDVLTTTRLELASGNATAHTLSLHREEIAPRVLGERAAERFRSHKPTRTLELTIAADLPGIEVDPMLFRRVLDNLLENADKYTPDASSAIVLRAKLQGDALEFEVEDHGVGIPEADLPRVFEPFFRGERSRSRGTGGVGLGLTLARRIVEAHGGRIEVASLPGQGTTVRVRIPRRA